MGYQSFNPTKGKNNIKIATFDIESENWIKPYYLSFYDGLNLFRFEGDTCISDFLKKIITHKYRAYRIYAHNGGKFDFSFLAEKLKYSKRKLDFLMSSSTCVQLSVFHNNEVDEDGNLLSRNCTRFVDSYRLLPYSLDKLTKDFDVEHKKIDFMPKGVKKKDFEYLRELFLKKDKRFYEYADNDSIGLYEVIQKFLQLLDKQNGELGLTLASTSLKTFKKSYLNNPLKMTNKERNDEMKLAYYGGRTEIFQLYFPEGKYYCYDVNSLYPFVMRNHYFPISIPRKIGSPNKEFITEEHGITECKVTCPKNLDMPLLPYRYKNKLYFPTGTFAGYWDNVLLAKAYQLGYKIEPKKGYIFQSEKIFKEYVDKFYSLKQNSKKDTSPYILAKLLLNTLYGKFGQSQESDMLMKLTTENRKKFEIVDIIDIDHNLFKVKTESKGTHFIPQISIHVTALSQLELYKDFEIVKSKGGITAYCDTDSLFTNCTLPFSDKLGDLKLEYTFKRGYFLLPKTYYIVGDKNKVKAKGYIKDFQDKLTENSYKKALFNNDYSDFIMQSPPTFNTMKTSYRRHKTFLSVDVRKKSMKHRYDKRHILKDYSTRPKDIKEILES